MQAHRQAARRSRLAHHREAGRAAVDRRDIKAVLGEQQRMAADAATGIAHLPGSARVQFRHNRQHCRVRFVPIGAPYAMTGQASHEARELARQRSESYRKRRRDGSVLVPIEISPHQLAALERLALLGVGDRDKMAIAGAVTRFLNTAPYLLALGDALWPEEREN